MAAPDCVNETAMRLIKEMDPVVLHGYTSAQGDAGVGSVQVSAVPVIAGAAGDGQGLAALMGDGVRDLHGAGAGLLEHAGLAVLEVDHGVLRRSEGQAQRQRQHKDGHQFLHVIFLQISFQHPRKTGESAAHPHACISATHH